MEKKKERKKRDDVHENSCMPLALYKPAAVPVKKIHRDVAGSDSKKASYYYYYYYYS